MEKIVQQIIAQSGTQKDRKALREWLKKQDAVLVKNRNQLVTALNTLDPKTHTTGMLHLFEAVTSEVEDITGLAEVAIRFLLSASEEEASEFPKLVSYVCSMLTQVLVNIGAPLKGVFALERGIRLLDGPEKLTTAHADYVYLCLKGGFPAAAQHLLDTDVTSLNGELKHTGFKHQHYLLYFFYGGLAYCAMKKFRRAKDFFEKCFTLPAVALSTVAVEAYKKHLLVSLLVSGAPELRRQNTSSAFRQMKSMTTPYQELATAFSTKDADAVAAVLTAYPVFAEDGNLGLVRQVIESLSNSQIRSFTETYVTLSLQALAEGAKLRGGLEELTQRLLRMTREGRLNARINEKDGMVSFSEAPNSYDDTASARLLHKQIGGVIRLGSQLRSLNEEIALSQEYIQRTTEQGPGRAGAGGPEAAMLMHMGVGMGGHGGQAFGMGDY